MYLGEMLAKTAVAAMVTAMPDDTNRHRYQLLHRLVRAMGWASGKNVYQRY